MTPLKNHKLFSELSHQRSAWGREATRNHRRREDLQLTVLMRRETSDTSYVGDEATPAPSEPPVPQGLNKWTCYSQEAEQDQIKVPSGTEWCHRRTIFGSLRHLYRFFKEPFPKLVLQKTYKGVSKNLKKLFFKAPFLVQQRTFQTRVL